MNTEVDYKVIVIGAGSSGLCMAIKLKEQGIDDLVLLDKAVAVTSNARYDIHTTPKIVDLFPPFEKVHYLHLELYFPW